MDDITHHGLGVEDVPRSGRRPKEPPADRVPLDRPDPHLDADIERALSRITPTDGKRVVLVAASFNSAI